MGLLQSGIKPLVVESVKTSMNVYVKGECKSTLWKKQIIIWDNRNEALSYCEIFKYM